jgi:Beta-lactamase enzyme family
VSVARGARAGLTLLLLAALAAPAPAAAGWRPHVREAIAYARKRAGTVRFAVRTENRVWGWHKGSRVPAASLLKAILLVAYLNQATVRHRPLDDEDYRLIGPMIRRSDSVAATRVLGIVGPAGVYRVARAARMRRFSLDPVIWGDSRVDAADQTRFFLEIDDFVAPLHRATALHLLSSIVPSQRWGIGRLRLSGWQVYFKGGWGAGTGRVEHQVALLRNGMRRVAAAVLITDSPSHAYAKRTLRGVFARLLRGL